MLHTSAVCSEDFSPINGFNSPGHGGEYGRLELFAASRFSTGQRLGVGAFVLIGPVARALKRALYTR